MHRAYNTAEDTSSKGVKQMKRIFSIFLVLIFLLTLTGLSESYRIHTTLKMRLSTRSGPSTLYTESGSYFKKGDPITALSKAYDKRNEIWWIQVEFEAGGKKYRAYTGHKRVNVSLDDLPEETLFENGRTNEETTQYYGPGTAFKTMQHKLPAGTEGLVVHYEDGFVHFEYFDEEKNQKRRVWLKENAVLWDGDKGMNQWETGNFRMGDVLLRSEYKYVLDEKTSKVVIKSLTALPGNKYQVLFDLFWDDHSFLNILTITTEPNSAPFVWNEGREFVVGKIDFFSELVLVGVENSSFSGLKIEQRPFIP